MKLKNNEEIEILRSSDTRYEKLTSEIWYQDEPVVQINKDKGKDKMEIELFNDFGDEEFIVRMPLNDFLEAIKIAKETLL
jgi:hypothetical protein